MAVYLTTWWEPALSPVLPVGEPGRYRVRAEATGRARIRALDADPARPSLVTGVETYLLRLWPER